MKTKILFLSFIFFSLSLSAQKVLVFSEPNQSATLFQKISPKFTTDTTSNPLSFNENFLKKYQSVVFLNRSINALNFRQSAEFQRFMKAGGGFVGIGRAAEKNYQWLWYENMIGGRIAETQLENPTQINLITNATIGKTTASPLWKITDKPLIFNTLPVRYKPVLMDLMGKTWAWHQVSDEGGKMFYTALGVENSTLQNTDFITLLITAIEEVSAKSALNYEKIADTALPHDEFFLKRSLTQTLQNPISLAALPDGNLLIAEQNGNISVFDNVQKSLKIMGNIGGSGLKKLKLDPEFNQNKYVYSFSDMGNQTYKVGRFQLTTDSLALSTDFVSQSQSELPKNAVYQHQRYLNAPYRLPKYFDRKLFRFDNEQGFVVETLDENEEVRNVEPFLPSVKFNFVQDLALGADGALYFLENNQLQKIDYSETNRKPLAKASADVYAGNAPLKVKFSSQGSIDDDPTDTLSFEWNFDGTTVSYEANPEFTFTKAGDYQVVMKVTDGKGGVAESIISIKVLTKAVKKR